MTTNLDKLIEQQRALAKQIRDAKRAGMKREREALARARNTLGDRLSTSMGANTPEHVAALGDLLDTEAIRDWVVARLAGTLRHESSHDGDAVSPSGVTEYVDDATAARGGDR